MIDAVKDAANTGEAPQPVPVDWYVMYNIQGAQTPPSPDDVGSSSLMNQVFHIDQFLLGESGIQSGDGTQAPSPCFPPHIVIRLQLKIPTQWMQIASGDEIRLYFRSANTNQWWIKIKVIYKEYFP